MLRARAAILDVGDGRVSASISSSEIFIIAYTAGWSDSDCKYIGETWGGLKNILPFMSCEVIEKGALSDLCVCYGNVTFESRKEIILWSFI